MMSHPDVILVNSLLSITRVSLVQNKCVFCQLRVHYNRHIEHHHGFLITCVLLLRWVDGLSWNDLNKVCLFCDRTV